MGKKTRHHYIPVFYLKGFTDPNDNKHLWAYDKNDGSILPPVSPRDIAVKKHYHTYINHVGQRDTETVENFIQKIEDECSAIVRKILKEESMTATDLKSFGIFVSSMLIRTPFFRTMVESIVNTDIKQLITNSATNKKSFHNKFEEFFQANDDIESCRQKILQGVYEFQVSDGLILKRMLNLIFNLSKTFEKMHWSFLKSTTESKFISSDNPLLIHDPDYRKTGYHSYFGIANKNIEISLPLSKDLAAIGTWYGVKGYVQANNTYIKEANRRTAYSSQQYLFASYKSEILAKFAKKYKDSCPYIVKISPDIIN